MTESLFRASAAFLLLPIALPGPALAQDAGQTAPAPAPVPAPSPNPGARLPVYTLPSDAQRFSLPPGNAPATAPPAATPTPAPAPAPTIVVPPIVRVPEQAEPRRAPARQRRPAAPPAEAAPSPTPAPAPVEAPAPTVAQPRPSTPTPAPAPAQAAPAPSRGLPLWGWGLGALVLALGGAGAFLLSRRRHPAEAEEAPAFEASPVRPVTPPVPADAVQRPAPPPAPEPEPVEPVRPQFVQRPAPPAPVPPPAPAQAGQPALAVALRPISGGIVNGEAVVQVEMGVTNHSGSRAEEICAVLAMISASPNQDGMIAGFHAGARAMPPSLRPFTLAPGESCRLTAELRLAEDRLHVVTVGGRPMFVPIVMIGLRWRGGLSLRSQGEAFMVGTGDGADGKLGPFWIDRGTQLTQRVSARKYAPARVAA